MEEKLEQLKNILAEVSDLYSTAALLGWDQQTYMPPAGAEGRGHQLSTISTIAHNKFTSEEVGSLLEALKGPASELDPDSDEARLLKVTTRHYEKETKVPPEMVAEFAQVTTMAHQVWQEARAENNFAKFQPYLEKVVELRRRYADLFAPYDHVYDPLLDDFEPGLKTADVQAIFNALRPQQVALIKEISARPQVDDSFLHQHFDEANQWDFGVEVITKFGYDWKRGRQDKSVHPFTTNFGIDDVRITTRILPDFFNSAFFSTTHEAGHGFYELGVDHAFSRSPLAGAASLSVHESQSRMWENLVGRSLPFWQGFYPRLQEYFPAQLGNVSLEAFYKGINKVEPSLIRVEADEATYNLHIMLRLELEIALMEGSLAVKDLPEAWNSRMEEYLGLIPPDDANGVLQDIHWSGGMIGYFSTYALGNLVSVQLWECVNRDIPDLTDQIRAGEFATLLSWMGEKIHRHGAKFEPQELIERVTGSKIDPNPYIRYLQNKYSQIYGF
ncbi:MAG TPA: carboxypeptidase M32 [Anaerolineales bacterium]|nr:carboxypeptidase M32 [Anaerolineales bacterium]